MKKSITSLIIGFTLLSSQHSVLADDLSTVYEQAKAADPTVLKAQALYMASQQDIDIARATLLPQINANAGYTMGNNESFGGVNSIAPGEIISADFDTFDYGISLNMELYHHDSWLSLSNAKKASHRTDLAYQIAKQDLILRVTSAYFDVLSAQDDLEFSVAEKKAIERQLEQTKQRYAVGLTAITDVHEAQAQFDNSVTEVIRAQNAIYNTEEALRMITNVYPNNLNKLNTERFSTARPMPDSANDWQTSAETNSLDLIAQKISVDIAKSNISIARAGHYPRVDFGANYGSKESTFSNSAGELDEPALDSYSVGVKLVVPIYSGNATSSSVDKAQSNYVAASQDLAQTHRNIVRVARNSYNTVNAAISGIKAFEQSVISAESALKATEAGFEVGTRTIVDVLDSTRNLYNAKRQLSATRYAYIDAVLTLKRAGGTITEQDILDINQGLMVPAAPTAPPAS